MIRCFVSGSFTKNSTTGASPDSSGVRKRVTSAQACVDRDKSCHSVPRKSGRSIAQFRNRAMVFTVPYSAPTPFVIASSRIGPTRSYRRTSEGGRPGKGNENPVGQRIVYQVRLSEFDNAGSAAPYRIMVEELVDQRCSQAIPHLTGLRRVLSLPSPEPSA